MEQHTSWLFCSELWSLLLYGLHVQTWVSLTSGRYPQRTSKLSYLVEIISTNTSIKLELFVPDVLEVNVTDKLCVAGDQIDWNVELQPYKSFLTRRNIFLRRINLVWAICIVHFYSTLSRREFDFEGSLTVIFTSWIDCFFRISNIWEGVMAITHLVDKI